MTPSLRSLLSLAALSALIEPVYSQQQLDRSRLSLETAIDLWERSGKSIVTPQAKVQLIQVSLNELSKFSSQYTTAEINTLRGALNGQGNPLGAPVLTKQCKKDLVGIEICNEVLISNLHLQGSINKVAFFWLSKYPTVQVSVEPSPPPDYEVVINGDKCKPSDKGYVVPSGNVSVRVTRPGKPPCDWNGALPEGTEKRLDCKL